MSFGFIVHVEEKVDGSVKALVIDTEERIFYPTPCEKRVAAAIKRAVSMAGVKRLRRYGSVPDKEDYDAALHAFSELEWALGLADMSTGGPEVKNR